MNVDFTTKKSPYLKFSQVLFPQELGLNENSAFVAQSPASLSEGIDSRVKGIFLQDDPYKAKTFSNGSSYRSCCFHGALGTYPFDGIFQRIIEGKDKFDKALVLTTNYHEAKKQAQRLSHQSVCAGKKEFLDRIRTATSIEKEDQLYQDRGVDANDQQILFYDISQLRMGIGTEVKKIKEKFFNQAKERLEQAVFRASPDEDQLKKEQNNYLLRLKRSFDLINGLPIAPGDSKLRKLFTEDNLEAGLKEILSESNAQVRKVFESRVANFIEKQNLTGTTQLYLHGAEEFKTDLGYEVLQEIVKQIKKANGGGDFNLVAIANFNYSHGPDKSLEAVFSHPIYLRTPRQYQLDERISPEIKPILVRSLAERATTTSQDIATVTKTTSFNNALAKRIQARIVDGDQRIFLRAHSNESMSALKDSFKREGSNISYGSIEENVPYFVDDKGIRHELASPVQLLAQWGQGFKVLMHTGYFDRLEEPADTVITATKVKSPDKLEELIAPLYTLRTNPSKKAHLVYYRFGKFDSNDLNDQNPDYLLKQIALRHTKNGSNVRQLISGSSINSRGLSLGASSDVNESEAYYEQVWNKYSEPVKHFWLNSFGSTAKLRGLIASYVRERDHENRIVSDTSLFNDELDYVWDLLNSRTIPDSSATFQHTRRDVFESLFRQMNKSALLRDYIVQYPSLLGIETQRDAQARVLYIYKQINNEVNKSRDQILAKMDKLFDGTLSYETKQSHRSNLIGEFLFQAGHIRVLEDQTLSSDGMKFEDIKLHDTLLVLTGAKVPGVESSIVSEFTEFIAKKIAEKDRLEENTSLGINRKLIKDLVENYLLENEAEFVQEANSEAYTNRETHLMNAAADLKAIEGDNDKFYRYLCDQPQGADLKRIMELNPALVRVRDAQELKVVINNLKINQNHNDKNVISNWQANFKNIEDGYEDLAQYIYQKKPDLIQAQNREGLTRAVEFLTGLRRLASKEEQSDFNAFIDFLFSRNPGKFSSAISRKNNLTLDQVKSIVTIENPGLMGIPSRELLVLLINKLLNEQIKAFNLKINPSIKLNNLAAFDYQRLVVRFVSQFDFDKFAESLGISVEALLEQYFPESVKNIFESNYQNILDEARKMNRNTDALEQHWHSIWSNKTLINAIAKALIIEKTLSKDFEEPGFSFGVNTRIVDDDGERYLVFNGRKISYSEYISSVHNMEDIQEDPLEHLSLSWTSVSELSSSKLDSSDYLPRWRKFLHDGLEECVQEALEDLRANQGVPSLGLINLLNNQPKNLLRTTSRVRLPVKVEPKIRASASIVKNSFMKALNISEDDLLKLFFKFISSEYFEKSDLHQSQTFPSLIAKFIGLLSGYESQDAQDTLIEFINFLGTDLKDERLIANLVKEVILLDREAFGDIPKSFKILKDFALKSSYHSEQTIDRIISGIGLKLPSYPNLKSACMRALLAQLDSNQEPLTFIFAIDRFWDSIAKAYFAVNFFDIDLDPELTIGDNKGSLTITILNARDAKPEIVVRYVDKEQIPGDSLLKPN